MGANGSSGSGSHGSNSHLVGDLSFSAAGDSRLPISDEDFAEELQLQEVISSSLLAKKTTKSEKGKSSRSRSRSRPRSESTLCAICTDTKSAAEMFTSRDCSHSFCTDCISKHIAAKLQDSMTVKCPEPKCLAALEPEMCSSFVPKEVLERWGDALFEATILKMKRSYCPFEDCAVAMIDDGEEAVTAVECQNCRRLFCAQCKVGWHGEMECGEFQNLRKEAGENREDMLTTKLAVSKKWKRCPNCRIYVEKNKGCNHITCRCGCNFCYCCGSNWDRRHKCSSSARQRRH